MGRKMLKMERIGNEKTKLTTYKKRKACLLKKANEFSTLCGVETCLILYGPKTTEAAETWPTDENKVVEIISKYRDTASSSCLKATHIHDFLSERAHKNTDNKKMATRTTMTMTMIKYRTWDEKLSGCSRDELCSILGDIDDKIHKAHSFVSVLEETKRQAFCGYNNTEQQQQLVPRSPIGHVGFPFLHPRDQVAIDMMIRRCDGYNFFPGICYGQDVQYAQ